MPTLDEIVDQLSDLRVSDLVTLTKRLESEWGVSATAVAPQVGPGPSNEQPVSLVEEQTEFTLVLEEFGAQKINVIKVVRELIPGIDLKSAKEKVESAPVAILEDVTRERAEQAAEKLRAEGAKVEIK